jgi:hypothetical protein
MLNICVRNNKMGGRESEILADRSTTAISWMLPTVVFAMCRERQSELRNLENLHIIDRAAQYLFPFQIYMYS